jgi:hydrogenase nickel incorporation protein HypA/HybF
MHELSIVMSIVDVAEEQVRSHQAKEVESIDLEIGALAGVDDHALEFAWEAGVKNTVLEKARRNINKQKGWAKCLECDKEFEIKMLYDPCPVCGEYLLQILEGKELKIQSMVLLN